MLYAVAGHHVTAAEIEGIPNMGSVRNMAAAHKIELMTLGDLARPEVFDKLAAASYDRVLFTEILEHITFNPVAMWRAIHRLLKPGGKIVLTTPNYYFSVRGLGIRGGLSAAWAAASRSMTLSA